MHDDSVHDISYDYYGKRIATCSSDHCIKVWDIDKDGKWQLATEFKAHDSAVTRVVWAHPEYGTILASCSLDRSVRIWQEQQGKFTEKARLLDSKGSVRDIAFAPNWMGLKLATCSTDGYVRIYEAFDVVNLQHWTLMVSIFFNFQEDFSIFVAGREIEGQCCLSWCQSRDKPPMMIVSCAKEHVAKVSCSILSKDFQV